MLSAKPWKADAIARLGLSVIVCVFAGSLLVSAQHYVSAGGKVSARMFYPLAVAALGCLAATLVLLGKPWPMENLPRRLLTLMVCAYSGLFLGAWVQQSSGVAGVESSIWRVIVASLSFQGAGLVLIARFVREHRVSWSEAFGFSNHRGKAVLLGTLIALLFLPLGWGLQQASALMMTHLPHFKLQPEEQLPVHMLRASMSWAGRITLGAAAILLGMASPYAARLFVDQLRHMGCGVGEVYGVSTIGSIVGTLGTAFYLIAWMGTRCLLTSNGVLLLVLGIVLAVIYLLRPRKTAA